MRHDLYLQPHVQYSEENSADLVFSPPRSNAIGNYAVSSGSSNEGSQSSTSTSSSSTSHTSTSSSSTNSTTQSSHNSAQQLVNPQDVEPNVIYLTANERGFYRKQARSVLQRQSSFFLEKNGDLTCLYQPSGNLGQGSYGSVRKFECTHVARLPIRSNDAWEPVNSNVLPARAVKKPTGDPQRFNATLPNESSWYENCYPNILFEIHNPHSHPRSPNKRVILDYFPGKTLHEIIHNDHLTNLQLLDLLINVGKKLQQHHQTGYVHLDLKADNIIVKDIPSGRQYAPDDITIFDGGLSQSIGVRRGCCQRKNGVYQGYPPEFYGNEQQNYFITSTSNDVYLYCYMVNSICGGFIPHARMRTLHAGLDQDPMLRTSLNTIIRDLESEFINKKRNEDLIAAKQSTINLSMKIRGAIREANIAGDPNAAIGTSRRCVSDLNAALNLAIPTTDFPQWLQKTKNILSQYLSNKLSQKAIRSKLVNALLRNQVINADEYGIYLEGVGCLCCTGIGFARRQQAV